MKSLVLVADGKPVLVMLRGDHQLSETKFAAKAGVAEFRQAQPDEIRDWFGAEAGSLGPVGVTNDDDSGGPGAGGPAQHDRRRQPQRLPPAPCDPGRGFSG